MDVLIRKNINNNNSATALVTRVSRVTLLLRPAEQSGLLRQRVPHGLVTAPRLSLPPCPPTIIRPGHVRLWRDDMDHGPTGAPGRVQLCSSSGRGGWDHRPRSRSWGELGGIELWDFIGLMMLEVILPLIFTRFNILSKFAQLIHLNY